MRSQNERKTVRQDEESLQKRDKAQSGDTGRTKPGRTARSVAALICIILLVAMYVITLFAAIFDSSSAGRLFRLCLGLTVAIPIFLWIFIWCIGVLEHRKTIASMEILNSNPDERRRMEEAFQEASEGGAGGNHEDVPDVSGKSAGGKRGKSKKRSGDV